jgi:starch synthase
MKNMHVQFVILGTGEPKLEQFFGAMSERFPGRAASHIGFSNELAHLIEAGCDFFLMPSLFEPCGLNQIYSLRYGTLPIVRATGGLDDTVSHYDEANGEGTGFKFSGLSPLDLYHTTGLAISTYYDRRHHLESLIQRAMRQNFSLRRCAEEYVGAYRRAIENKNRLI